MVVRGYRSVDVANPRGGYHEPLVVTTPILYDKDGHYVKPNMVALKYPNFKKNDLYVHVRVFNYVVKANVETSKKYSINAFSYMLKDTTSNLCHNYMSKFPKCIFLELTQAFCKRHRKT
jgi:hypothetical protein